MATSRVLQVLGLALVAWGVVVGALIPTRERAWQVTVKRTSTAPQNPSDSAPGGASHSYCVAYFAEVPPIRHTCRLVVSGVRSDGAPVRLVCEPSDLGTVRVPLQDLAGELSLEASYESQGVATTRSARLYDGHARECPPFIELPPPRADEVESAWLVVEDGLGWPVAGAKIVAAEDAGVIAVTDAWGRVGVRPQTSRQVHVDPPVGRTDLVGTSVHYDGSPIDCVLPWARVDDLVVDVQGAPSSLGVALLSFGPGHAIDELREWQGDGLVTLGECPDLVAILHMQSGDYITRAIQVPPTRETPRAIVRAGDWSRVVVRGRTVDAGGGVVSDPRLVAVQARIEDCSIPRRTQTLLAGQRSVRASHLPAGARWYTPIVQSEGRFSLSGLLPGHYVLLSLDPRWDVRTTFEVSPKYGRGDHLVDLGDVQLVSSDGFFVFESPMAPSEAYYSVDILGHGSALRGRRLQSSSERVGPLAPGLYSVRFSFVDSRGASAKWIAAARNVILLGGESTTVRVLESR